MTFFVSIFFNAAVMGVAMIRLEGGDPTVRDGIRVASRHVRLAGWALLTATVGLVLLGFRGAKNMSKNRFRNRKSDIRLPGCVFVLPTILGSRVKVKILRLLAVHPQREFTLSEIAKTLRLSMGSVTPAVRQLLGTHLVVARRVGRSRALRINKSHFLFDPLRALFEVEASQGEVIARDFAERLPRQGVRAVILFGSAARGAPGPTSDVDVLVVADNPHVAQEAGDLAGSSLERHDVNVSPLVLTTAEVKQRLEAYDPLLLTIAQEGKLLRGKAPWLGR